MDNKTELKNEIKAIAYQNMEKCVADDLTAMLDDFQTLCEGNKDIKYLGIPNISFSLTKESDDRESEFSLQRIARGFDDSETWSLTDTISNFIIPRLKIFREINPSTPCGMTSQEWDNKIDKMIRAFELTVKDKGSRNWSESEDKEVDEGLDLFREWFMALWW